MAEYEPRVETVIEMDVPPGYRELARLDVYLTGFIENATRAKVQQGIREGRVSINGRVVVKVSQKVQPSDHITCLVMRPPPMEVIPEAIPLDIVYEDDDLAVVNKPAGMVVHPAYGHRSGTLVNAMLYHVGGGVLSLDATEDDVDDGDVGLSTINLKPVCEGEPVARPGIVHRLDKGTSGLLVVAKNDVAHSRLAAQFEKHSIRRRYRAIVWGAPDPPDGTVATYLGRDPRNRKRMAVVGEKRGKWAVTHYRTLETFAHAALLEFELETGRTHQIRVHARHIGHSLLGDTTYDGDRIKSGPDTGRRRAFFNNLFELMPRQALHAKELGFVHPRSGELVVLETPLPPDMRGVLDQIRRIESDPKN